jgi:hypothetical protein
MSARFCGLTEFDGIVFRDVAVLPDADMRFSCLLLGVLVLLNL